MKHIIRNGIITIIVVYIVISIAYSSFNLSSDTKNTNLTVTLTPYPIQIPIVTISTQIPITTTIQTTNIPTSYPPTTQPTTILNSKTRLYPYYFKNNGGDITFTAYNYINTNLSKEDHLSYGDMNNDIIGELLHNEEQDDYIQPILDKIKATSPNPDYQAKVAISLVQHIPYDNENTRMTDWYYPYETLYLNRGVCSDKSILLIYLLNELGYDAVLFRFKDENHMAVGVKSSPNYDFRDTGYAIIETTKTTIITDLPTINDEVVDSYPETVKLLHNGTRELDVSEEYRDAIEYNLLYEKGGEAHALDTYDYHQWLNLSDKYDLFYDI